MRAYVPISIRIIIAILFLLSAAAKLYPSPNLALGTFEAKQLIPMGFSEGLAAYFSRSLIAIEFGLGLAILQPHYLRKLIIPATIAILAVFSIHLTYEIISQGASAGNCGCFGELLPMTPLQALIKNVIAIGLLIYLWKIQAPDEKKKLSYVLLLFTTVGLLMFALAPVQLSSTVISTSIPSSVHNDFSISEDNDHDLIDKQEDPKSQDVNTVKTEDKKPEEAADPAPKAVISKYSKYSDLIPAEVRINEGKKLLCFFAPTCEHCMETAKTLTKMRNDIKGFPPIHIVFMDEGPEEIPAFFKYAGRDYSYRVAPVIKFWEMLGNEYDTPAVVYLWNGNVNYFADGINDNAFKEEKLKAALNKK